MKKIMLWILVISCMGVIFYFSSENAEKSTENSRSIITNTKIIENKASNETEKELIIQKADIELRIFAHAFEYFTLSILVCFLIKEYNTNIKSILLISFLICFIYSCSDEIHQLYVIGRSCEFSDIIVDNMGTIFGELLFYLSGIKIWKK